MPGLINEANFFVIIIALLVMAFILGLLTGKVFGRKSDSRPSSSSDSVNINTNPQLTNPAEQDANQNINTVNRQEKPVCDPIYRYFYYW